MDSSNRSSPKYQKNYNQERKNNQSLVHVLIKNTLEKKTVSHHMTLATFFNWYYQ